jgi:putative ABC transport system permease protein
MIAVTASVLGGSLLVASGAPFDRAFAQQHGAHLTAQFDAAKATAAQLTASAHAAGVAAAAGPVPDGVDHPTPTARGHRLADDGRRPRRSAGRSGRRVTLTEGRWATGPGEIVLIRTAASRDHPRSVRTGPCPSLPGSPTLKVVGAARSVSRTADAWVTPAQVTELDRPGRPGGYQMLYRFTAADTAAQVEAAGPRWPRQVPGRRADRGQSWLTPGRPPSDRPRCSCRS